MQIDTFRLWITFTLMGEAWDLITQTKRLLSNHLHWFKMHSFNEYLLSIYYVPKANKQTKNCPEGVCIKKGKRQLPTQLDKIVVRWCQRLQRKIKQEGRKPWLLLLSSIITSNVPFHCCAHLENTWGDQSRYWGCGMGRGCNFSWSSQGWPVRENDR